MTAEGDLARALLDKLRPDFAAREATAQQFAELLLDAVDAALPLTQHAPSELALPQLETLAQQLDVFSWDGAPGWDVVLAHGLAERAPLAPGPSVVDGIGGSAERTQQRGELKRRAQAEAQRLLTSGRALELVAAHASLLRLAGHAAVFGVLHAPTDANAGALPPESLAELRKELDERGEGFTNAQDEWLATLLAHNPAAAAEPQFRTFFAGLSQSLRAVRALHGGAPYDLESLLAAVVSWQPARWPRLRAGAPSSWISELCPPASRSGAATGTAGQGALAAGQTTLAAGQAALSAGDAADAALRAEADAALALFSRLWYARAASTTAFVALAALFTARCATVAALCEELAKDRAGD